MATSVNTQVINTKESPKETQKESQNTEKKNVRFTYEIAPREDPKKTKKAKKASKSQAKKASAKETKKETKSTGRSASIYKTNLFEGKSAQEKKIMRRKIRKERDSFIKDFKASDKSPASLKKIKKSWNDFTSKIYQDISKVFDQNTNSTSQKEIQEFLQAMATTK